ncbi:hypothetical protein I551_2700 [Mycobacterium ulcerans str. Harvey]|uniref:Uncharacterized protein n=1 Tax=Mycobacterium ulcerans str. Harvey TaxID=1299332 RepID=A0ABP3AIB8_MYCUL|nr:hypothetical protein I551_2700 [Mycobacterium ulcerans str. Harvey]
MHHGAVHGGIVTVRGRARAERVRLSRKTHPVTGPARGRKVRRCRPAWTPSNWHPRSGVN